MRKALHSFSTAKGLITLLLVLGLAIVPASAFAKNQSQTLANNVSPEEVAADIEAGLPGGSTLTHEEIVDAVTPFSTISSQYAALSTVSGDGDHVHMYAFKALGNTPTEDKKGSITVQCIGGGAGGDTSQVSIPAKGHSGPFKWGQIPKPYLQPENSYGWICTCEECQSQTGITNASAPYVYIATFTADPEKCAGLNSVGLQADKQTGTGSISVSVNRGAEEGAQTKLKNLSWGGQTIQAPEALEGYKFVGWLDWSNVSLTDETAKLYLTGQYEELDKKLDAANQSDAITTDSKIELAPVKFSAAQADGQQEVTTEFELGKTYEALYEHVDEDLPGIFLTTNPLTYPYSAGQSLWGRPIPLNTNDTRNVAVSVDISDKCEVVGSDAWNIDSTSTTIGQGTIIGRDEGTWDKVEGKRCYDITLPQLRDKKFLGLDGSNFTLVADYYDDSLIRNRMSYELANNLPKLTAATPEAVKAEVYLDQKLLGVYTVTQTPESLVGDDADAAALAAEGNGVNADWVVELDATASNANAGTENEDWFTTTNDQDKTTKPGDKSPSAVSKYRVTDKSDDTDTSQIKSSLDDMFSVVASGDFDQAAKLIDMNNWAQAYVLDELMKAEEIGYKDFYIYQDASTGKLCRGPIWDYDYSSGNNVNKYAASTTAQAATLNSWYNALMDMPRFRALVKEAVEVYGPDLTSAGEALMDKVRQVEGDEGEGASAIDREERLYKDHYALNAGEDGNSAYKGVDGSIKWLEEWLTGSGKALDSIKENAKVKDTIDNYATEAQTPKTTYSPKGESQANLQLSTTYAPEKGGVELASLDVQGAEEQTEPNKDDFHYAYYARTSDENKESDLLTDPVVTAGSEDANVKLNAGDYWVRAEANDDSANLIGKSAPAKVTVDPLNVTVEFTNQDQVTKTWGDEDFDLPAQVKGQDQDVVAEANDELTYKVNKQNPSGSDKSVLDVDDQKKLKITGVGTATVEATFDGNANYTGSTSGTVTVQVNKANGKGDVSIDDSWTYGDSANHNATFDYGNDDLYKGESPSVTYTYKKQEGQDSGSTELPQNAGSYKVSAQVAENDHYNAYTSNEKTFTIDKANLNVNVENPADTYNVYRNSSATSGNANLTLSVDGVEKNGSIEHPNATISFDDASSNGVKAEVKNDGSSQGKYEVTLSPEASGDLGAKTLSAKVTTDDANYNTPSQQQTINVKLWECTKAPTPVGTTLTYNKKEQTGINAAGSGVSLSDDKATDAGTHHAKAALQENYAWDDENHSTDEKDISWEIQPKSINDSTVTISMEESAVYSGGPVAPKVEVVDKEGTENTLTLGKDYTVSGDAARTNVGESDVTISGTGNYSHSANKNFTISPLNLSSQDVTETAPDQTYTGSELKPKVTVKTPQGYEVSSDAYDVTYSNNVNAGTGHAAIKAKETDSQGFANVTGDTSCDFTIKQADLAGVTVSVPTQTYDGKQKQPTPTVTFNGKTVSTDEYTVGYENNTNAGNATVKLTSQNKNFTGTKTQNFTIGKKAATLSVNPATLTMKVSDNPQTVQVSYDGDGNVNVTSQDMKVAQANYDSTNKRLVVTPKGKGETKVTISTSGEKNYTAPKTVTLTVKVSDITRLVTISSALDRNKVLDIAAGSSANSANAQIYASNQSPAQRFRIVPVDDTYYRIINVGSGKVIDVKSAGKKDGTNVHQYQSNNTDAQLWKMIPTGDNDGSYYFVSKCNELYLDVAGAKSNNGTNVQVYTGNQTKAQKFYVNEINPVAGIESGKTYVLKSNVAKNNGKDMVLDISAAKKTNSANAQIYERNGTDAQAFILNYDPNTGYYTITNKNSRKVLDVAGGKSKSTTNVQQYDSNSTAAQKWALIPAKGTSDTYVLVSATGDACCLDVAGAKNANSTNVRIYTQNGTQAQKWTLEKVNS